MQILKVDIVALILIMQMDSELLAIDWKLWEPLIQGRLIYRGGA